MCASLLSAQHIFRPEARFWKVIAAHFKCCLICTSKARVCEIMSCEEPKTIVYIDLQIFPIDPAGSWWYVGNLSKDRNFIPNFLTWLINGVKNWYLREVKKSDPNFTFFDPLASFGWPLQPQKWLYQAFYFFIHF